MKQLRMSKKSKQPSGFYIMQNRFLGLVMNSVKLSAPFPTQGAALRYIGILSWHLVVTLEYDPQFDGIKM